MQKIVERKGFIYILLSFFYSLTCQAQDPQFSQFYANQLYLNPAFAGTAKCPRLTLNYRNQWPGIDNSFVTYSAGFDMQIDAINGGLGVLIMNDQAGEGILNTTSAALIYSYQFAVNRKFSIRAGFEGRFVQKSLNVGNLTFGDMIDPRRGFVFQTQEQIASDNRTFADFSTGFLGFSEKLYFGFAAHHLTEPDESFLENNVAPLPRKLTVHGGGVFKFGIRNEDMTWSPNVLFQTQDGAQQLNVGMYVSKGPVVLGVWSRLNDSFIVLTGFQQDEFKIGYSYDLTSSRLSSESAGSHEISFIYIFPCPIKKVRFKTISCPSF